MFRTSLTFENEGQTNIEKETTIWHLVKHALLLQI